MTVRVNFSAFVAAGSPLAPASGNCTVKVSETGANAIVFTDRVTAGNSNPVSYTDGNLSFYINPGRYDLEFSNPSETWEDIEIRGGELSSSSKTGTYAVSINYDNDTLAVSNSASNIQAIVNSSTSNGIGFVAHFLRRGTGEFEIVENIANPVNISAPPGKSLKLKPGGFASLYYHGVTGANDYFLAGDLEDE